MESDERERWLQRLELACAEALAELRALDDAATASLIEDVESLAERIRHERDKLVGCPP